VEFPLESVKLRRAVLVASVAVAALVSFQAARFWLAYHWIDSERLEWMERGAALVPGNADSWDRLGRFRQWDFENPDVPRAIVDYQKTVQIDPLSARYWMDLAGAYETDGDGSRAQQAFERAKDVYPISAEVAWNHGNYLLRQQRTSEGYTEIRRAVRTDPKLLPLAISRTWRSSEDVNELLDHVLPSDVDAYLQALDFFQSIHAADPGLVVWERLASLGKPFALRRTFLFLEELIREDRADDARHVWSGALAAAGLPQENSINHSVIYDGGFAQDFTNGGLGWRWDPPYTGGVAIDFDSAPPSKRGRSVRLEFSGGNNLSVEQPAQYVAVEPNRTLHFHAWIRTEGITTESGMRFSIVDPRHPNEVNVATENLTGSNPWTAVDAEVTTGSDTHFVIVRLLRPPSRLFENKLSGTVWIADVSLVPSSTEEESPSR
jgi:tetratricopeptide (TPR) repeat protein